MRSIPVLVALIAVLSMAGGALGAPSPVAALGPAAVPLSPYLEERSRLLSALGGVRAAPVPGRPDAEAALLLDLAALQLGSGLVCEAGTIVAALADAPLGSALSARRGALRAAFAALDPRAEPSDAPPLAAFGGLPGAPALRGHALVRAGRRGEGLDAIADAPEAVRDLSPALRARVVPTILDAAIDADRSVLAMELRDRLEAVAHLSEPGALAYLTARLLAGAGDAAGAAELRAEAARAPTLWGHRARLAGIEHDLASGGLRPAAALDRLAEARARWGGGSAALETSRRIAALAAEAGDPLVAAEARGEVWWRDGRSIASAEAALGALGAFYDAGTSGDLSLHALVEGHRRLAPQFRFLPGYDLLGQRFADHLASRGATAAAAEEYALIRAHLEVGAERGILPRAPARLDDLRLAEAAADVAGGRLDAARALLDAPLAAGAPEALRRRAELGARLLVLSGEGSAGEAPAEAGPELLARSGRAHVLAGRWAPALEAYRALWRATDGSVGAEDAGAALLAAHHGGDPEMRVLAEHALAASGGVRADVAEGGLAPRDAPDALDAAHLRGALGRAEAVLRASIRLAEGAPGAAPADGPAINTSLTGGP